MVVDKVEVVFVELDVEEVVLLVVVVELEDVDVVDCVVEVVVIGEQIQTGHEMK